MCFFFPLKETTINPAYAGYCVTVTRNAAVEEVWLSAQKRPTALGRCNQIQSHRGWGWRYSLVVSLNVWCILNSEFCSWLTFLLFQMFVFLHPRWCSSVFKVNHGLPVYAHACAGQSLSVAHAGLKSSGSSHDVKGLSVCVCVFLLVWEKVKRCRN